MNQEIGTIWQAFHKELKAFIIQKVGNKNDANDILQEAFIKVIQHKDKVSQAKNVRQYLYGIVRNTTMDYFRKRKEINVELSETLGLSDQEEETLNTMIADCCIQPFIEQLPDKYKEAIMMSEIKNIPQKELAQQLNISYSGAKSRVQRGREKLKDLVLDCCQLKSDKYGNLSMEENNDCDQ